MKIIGVLFLLVCVIHAEPILSSWDIDGSRKYARIYKVESDVTNQSSYTTWDRETATTGGGNGDQLEPTYAGIHEVSYDDDFVYLRTTGMGAHVMGPWWNNRSDSTADHAIFVNWP